MRILARQRFLILGAIVLGLLLLTWTLDSAWLIAGRIGALSGELQERHKELLRFFEEIIK